MDTLSTVATLPQTEIVRSGRKSGAVTRSDLANAIHRKVGVPQAESAKYVDMVFEEILERIVAHEDVKLASFGAFLVRAKKERLGRNPKTGVSAMVSARLVVVFKSSKILRAKLTATTDIAKKNLARAELTALERDEHVAEWIRLAEKKAGEKPAQVAQVSKGGRGNEGGLSKAARDLGIDRDEGRRAVCRLNLHARAVHNLFLKVTLCYFFQQIECKSSRGHRSLLCFVPNFWIAYRVKEFVPLPSQICRLPLKLLCR